MARRSGRFKAVDEDADEDMDVEGMWNEDYFLFLSLFLLDKREADDSAQLNDIDDRVETGELAHTSAVSMAQADNQV